jgi:PEP-CTERM motif
MQNGYAAATRIVLLGLVVAIGAKSQAAPITVEVRTDTVLVQTWNSAALGCTVIVAGVESCQAINNSNPLNNFDTGHFNFTSVNLQLTSNSITIGNISVDNQDTATHQLTVDIILSVPNTGPNTKTSGSLAGSITDGITPADDDGNVTISTVAGSALYTALLDNVVWQTLSAHATSYSDPASFTLPTPNNFGFPSPPSLASPTITSTITLRYDFTLTAKDQAGLQGSLRSVPEPGTAMLVGLGLIALARAGRRR